jgi:hypothetical protein
VPWLKPIILAAQKAELRRIVVQSQPRENSSQSPISGFFLSQEKPITKKGLMEWLTV